MANLKLTEKSVAALPPATQHASSCPGGECACPLQSYYWDTELVGFGVVVGRTGSKTFIARAWVGKKRRRVKIGVAGTPRPDGHPWTVALARIEARQLLGRMSAGEDPNAGKRATSAPPPSTGPTLRQAMELHVTNMRAGRNRRRRVCAPRSIHKIGTEIPRHDSLPPPAGHPGADRAPRPRSARPGCASSTWAPSRSPPPRCRPSSSTARPRAGSRSPARSGSHLPRPALAHRGDRRPPAELAQDCDRAAIVVHQLSKAPRAMYSNV